MKRRWFLAGLALPAVVASCRAAGNQNATDERADEREEGLEDVQGEAIRVVRNSRTLVMATAANYPPYEQMLETEAVEASTLSDNSDTQVPEPEIVGFDIDLAQLIAKRLDRKLTIVDLEFGALIPALVNDEVDMVMAALNPSRSRKQRVDFSDIYYRARHALVSLDGYLRPRDLSYQTIGVQAGSVQARYVDTTDELADLDIVPYPTLEEMFEALDIGAISGAFLEANVAKQYVRRYPAFEAQIMPSDEPTGSAIALSKGSPLRRDINRALADIKSSGEMDSLIIQWFS